MSDSQLRTLIKSSPMSRFQIGVVALCTLITALDGFDVLVVAFTAPALSEAWNLGPTEIGLLFSAGLVGMGLGALFLAPIGDWLGRRPAVIICLLIMAVGMTGAGLSENYRQMAAWRVFTGLGIGAILANVNIVVGEYANDRHRDLCTSIMTAGYQLGAVLGGMLAIWIMRYFEWREVYFFGGIVAVVLIPVTLWMLPESLDFLRVRRPPNALARINRLLARMGRPGLAELPATGAGASPAKPRLSSLFLAGRRLSTVAACAGYLLMMMSLYFFVSWAPKIITEMGLSAESGISSVVLMNTAGVVSCLVFGSLARRVGVRRLSAIAMFGVAAAGVGFGVASPTTGAMLGAATVLGFFLASSVAALYAVVPKVFPVELRTTGTGMAMSFGRLGAAAGPYIAGLLIAAGMERAIYCLLMVIPVFLAAITLRWMTPIAEDAAALPEAGGQGGHGAAAARAPVS